MAELFPWHGSLLRNTAKGLPDHDDLQDVPESLGRVKWYLWHGNVFRALQLLHFIEMDLEIFETENEVARKLLKAARAFGGYIKYSNEKSFGRKYK